MYFNPQQKGTLVKCGDFTSKFEKKDFCKKKSLTLLHVISLRYNGDDFSEDVREVGSTRLKIGRYLFARKSPILYVKSLCMPLKVFMPLKVSMKVKVFEKLKVSMKLKSLCETRPSIISFAMT